MSNPYADVRATQHAEIMRLRAERDRLREALTLSDEIIADLSQRVIQLSLWKERVTGGALAKEAGK
jgi:hypothetical protein